MPLSVRELTGNMLPSGMRRSKVIVRARCGEDNPVDEESGKDWKGGDAPEWTEENEPTLLVPRWGGDEGVLVISVYVCGKRGKSATYIGGSCAHRFLSRRCSCGHAKTSVGLTLFLSLFPVFFR